MSYKDNTNGQRSRDTTSAGPSHNRRRCRGDSPPDLPPPHAAGHKRQRSPSPSYHRHKKSRRDSPGSHHTYTSDRWSGQYRRPASRDAHSHRHSGANLRHRDSRGIDRRGHESLRADKRGTDYRHKDCYESRQRSPRESRRSREKEQSSQPSSTRVHSPSRPSSSKSSTRLPVDEAVLNSAHQSGTVSYAGSHGNISSEVEDSRNNWEMKELVCGTLSEVYYTLKNDQGVQVLSPTENLESLHNRFRSILLEPAGPLPPHVSFLSSKDHPPNEVSSVFDGCYGEEKQAVDGHTDSVDVMSPRTTVCPTDEVAETKVYSNTDLNLDTSDFCEGKLTPLDDKSSIDEMELIQEEEDSGSEQVDHFSSPHETSLTDGDDSGLPTNRSLVDSSLPYNTISKDPRRSRDQCCYGQPLVDSSPWHCYSITVSPSTNFKSGLTTITSDSGQLYTFRGFSMATKHPIQQTIPTSKFEQFGTEYTVDLAPTPSLDIFTEEDLLLFQEYLFVRLLELYDWVKELKPFYKEMMFLPLFVREQDGSHEVLPMAQVLKFLIDIHQPLGCLMKGQRSNGLLVASFNKSPFCVRVDELKWSKTAETQTQNKLQFGHYSVAVNRTRNHKMDKRKKEKSKYYKLLSKKSTGKLSRKEHFVFLELKTKFEGKDKVSAANKELTWISSEGFSITGLYCDIVQHTLLLSYVFNHILLHDSLLNLQKVLGYTFKDLSLFHRAITHPSCTTLSYQLAEDHFKTTLLNCGLPKNERISGQGVKENSVKKGLKGLIESIENGNKRAWLENNEQLEFLGDAVLEYICSIHLYLMCPEYSVGKLSTERQTLVKNKTLGQLASQLKLTSYMLTNKKVEFTAESLAHTGANCLEAILGAVLIDQGLEEVDGLFARLAFPEQEQYTRWMCQHNHPLVQEHPDGDRHLIEEFDVLKGLVSLEEKTGVQFKHIQLLLRAFTHASHNDTDIIKGNYQRMEFLGDAILQFLVSKYVYLRFPSHHEGHLSMLRISLVHNKQLASLCQELGFDKYIVINNVEKIKLTGKLLADVVESYIAALTLDQGLTAAEKFLEEHLFPKLLTSVQSTQLVDANTRLHQAAVYTCKQQGVAMELPIYKVLPSKGTPSKPMFKVAVHFEKKLVATGTAPSIREARRLAAEEALKSSFLRIPPSHKVFQQEKVNK